MKKSVEPIGNTIHFREFAKMVKETDNHSLYQNIISQKSWSVFQRVVKSTRKGESLETFTIYKKAVEPKPPIISIADLIPIGRENAIKRNELLARCVEAQIAFTDRMMRKEIEKAKRDFVILNHSNGNGYYRPSIEDMQDLQRYIRQEEKRAKSTFKNIKRAKALCEDYLHGRTKGSE